MRHRIKTGDKTGTICDSTKLGSKSSYYVIEIFKFNEILIISESLFPRSILVINEKKIANIN